MTNGIDHIGIAVKSIKVSCDFYIETMGMVLDSVEEVVSEGVRVAILYSGTQRIELLEPLNESSPVAKFIQKRGEGIHHVAYTVSDIQSKVEKLRENNPEMLIEPAPRIGAHNCEVAFLHPKHSFGTLIEWVERPK